MDGPEIVRRALGSLYARSGHRSEDIEERIAAVVLLEY